MVAFLAATLLLLVQPSLGKEMDFALEDVEEVTHIKIDSPSKLLTSLWKKVNTPAARATLQQGLKDKSPLANGHPLELLEDIVNSQLAKLDELPEDHAIEADLHMSNEGTHKTIIGMTVRGKYHSLPSIGKFDEAMKAFQKVPLLKKNVHIGKTVSKPADGNHLMQTHMMDLAKELEESASALEKTAESGAKAQVKTSGRPEQYAAMAFLAGILIGGILILIGIGAASDTVWMIGGATIALCFLLLILEMIGLGGYYLLFGGSKSCKTNPPHPQCHKPTTTTTKCTTTTPACDAECQQAQQASMGFSVSADAN